MFSLGKNFDKGVPFCCMASLGALNCIWTTLIKAKLASQIYKLSFIFLFLKIHPLLLRNCVKYDDIGTIVGYLVIIKR